MRYDKPMKKAPKVDRVEFDKVLARMLATPPSKRKDTKTPKPAPTR